MKRIYLITYYLLFAIASVSQVVTIDKPWATQNDEVTISFNAKLGNGVLAGFTGNVYAYTGVITTESNNDGDWKHVQSNWGTVNPELQLTSLGNDIYSLSFNIAGLYDLLPGEEVIKLAFLFHNESYSLIGRDEGGKDIFVYINQQTGGSYVDHTLEDYCLKVNTNTGQICFTFYNEYILKTQFYPTNYPAPDTSFTVDMNPEPLSPELSDEANFLSFSTTKLKVLIQKDPVKLFFIESGDTILQDDLGFYKLTAGGGTSFRIKTGESFYGTGSRAIPIDRRGKRLYVYNQAQYGYSNNVPTLNLNIPFLVSNKGYGIFADNRYPMYIDIASSKQNILDISMEGGNFRYYIIGGKSYEKVLDNYTLLTGKQPLPPLWSLGYIQSKYGYQTETQARNIVNLLKQQDFPIDALVLDLYWFGSTNDMGNLNWDYSNWPNPIKMMDDFNKQNVKTILITEPYFTLNSENYSYLSQNELLAKNVDGTPFVFWGFWAGNASLLDLTRPEAQNWMWSFYHNRRNEGVAGWWCDLGEPESHPSEIQHEFGPARSVHNIYSLIWAKMLHENYRNYFSNERLFNLTRSGFAGMQRYSTFPWSGDIQRSWEGLNAQIPIMLGTGMSGVGYMHSDAGGFVGQELNGELFARWIQMAVFSPVLRVHGVGSVEPVHYAEPFKSIARKYIKLRYRFLPYNYTLAWENSTKGLPFARQLDFYEAENPGLKDINDTYLWGKNLLVAPILAGSVTNRQVKFPQGTWIDFFNHSVYSGNATSTIGCSIDNLLLFARAGSFVPLTGENVTNTSQYRGDSIQVVYFPDQSVPFDEYTLFCDNGSSTNSLQEQAYDLIRFEGYSFEKQIEIQISGTAGNYTEAPPERNIRYEIRRVHTEPSNVRVDEADIEQVSSLYAFRLTSPAWFWSSSENILYVHHDWSGETTTISIQEGVLGLADNPGENPDFSLDQIFPLPFEDYLNINYTLSRTGNYSLLFHSSDGKLVYREDFSNAGKGTHVYRWNTPSLSPGIYQVRLSDGRNGVSIKAIKK